MAEEKLYFRLFGSFLWAGGAEHTGHFEVFAQAGGVGTALCIRWLPDEGGAPGDLKTLADLSQAELEKLMVGAPFALSLAKPSPHRLVIAGATLLEHYIYDAEGVQDLALRWILARNFVQGKAVFRSALVLGKAGAVLPSSSKSVSSDPGVVTAFPIAPLLVEQAKQQLTWPGNAPFNWGAPFLLGFTNISKGTWTAEQAHEETVKSVQKLIIDYIASN